MDTFCHAVCCMMHIYMQLNRQCCETQSMIIIYMMHATFMYSEGEEALAPTQLGVRFLADSNSWNVNGKPQNCKADTQEY